MIPEILIKLALYGALVAALSAGGYSVYSSIRQGGYDEAETKYTLIIKAQQTLVDTKLKNLEILSNTLVVESRESSTLLTKDISALIKARGKTLTIVKEGKCVPTQEFSDTFNEINKRVNESMKETSK